MKLIDRLFIVLSVLVLAGCATVPFGPSAPRSGDGQISNPYGTAAESTSQNRPDSVEIENAVIESAVMEPLLEGDHGLSPVIVEREPFNSAETALLATATQSQEKGDLLQASAMIERALRINPHSAKALFALAQLRVEQQQVSAAEQLLLKAVTAASYQEPQPSVAFQRQLWELLLQVRQQLRDVRGIALAKEKIKTFSNDREK